MDELPGGDARGTDEARDVEQRLNRLLEEETRRIQGNTADRRQLLRDEAIVTGRPGPAHFAPSVAQEYESTIDDVDVDEPDDPVVPDRAALDETIFALSEAGAAEWDGTERATVVARSVPDPALDATELLDDFDDLDDLDETQLAQQPVPAGGQTVPGVIPVDSTMLRPMARQVDDDHLVVRNTRDYDHDAQSSNMVNPAKTGTFDTIKERRSDRDLWRDPYARSSRHGDAPGEGNSRSKLRPLLAIFLVALVLGGGGAVLTYGMELWGGKTVPYVVGESQANAEERLTEKGFTVRVEAEPADDAIGKVLSQEPDSGTRIDEGGEVLLVVAANRTMPDVVGLTSDEAKNILQEAGATNIEVVTRPSRKKEGTVLKVSPKAGEAFVSRSPVVLTVATHFTVPDVVGKKESDAVDIIKENYLKAEVVYVVSDQTVRTVISTSPAAGEIIKKGGTVTVQVSSPYPTDIYHLSEFFGHSSQDVDSFLLSKGFEFDKGGIDNLGNAVQTYTSTDKGTITFSSQPHLRGLKLSAEGSSNVLSTGAPIAGVRLDCPKSLVPDGYTRSSLIKLGKDCGFKGMKERCDNTTMKPPAGAPRISAQFACASGEMGNLAWTVLIVNGRAVATCAKKNLYTAADLQPFGGSLSQFMAYQEVYLSSEYQVKEEKKDDKKDENKDDKKEGDEATDGQASGEDNAGGDQPTLDNGGEG